MKHEKDGFEKQEEVDRCGYWEDPRWTEAVNLRKENRQIEANGLVGKIRSDWGIG